MSDKTALLQEAFGFYDEEGTGTLHIDFLRDIVMYHGEGCPDVRLFLDPNLYILHIFFIYVRFILIFFNSHHVCTTFAPRLLIYLFVWRSPM